MRTLRTLRRRLYTGQRLLGLLIAALGGPRKLATHRLRAEAQKRAALNRRVK